MPKDIEKLRLPDRVTLTIAPTPTTLATQSFNVTVLVVTDQGIGWRDDRAHPDATTFTPWHRVVSMDW